MLEIGLVYCTDCEAVTTTTDAMVGGEMEPSVDRCVICGSDALDEIVDVLDDGTPVYPYQDHKFTPSEDVPELCAFDLASRRHHTS